MINYPDTLASNNPEAYGIVFATQVQGHKFVKTLADLYKLSDAILSESGTNTNDDAIGQEWYVADASSGTLAALEAEATDTGKGKKYRLKDWAKKNQAEGWEEVTQISTAELEKKLKDLEDKIMSEMEWKDSVESFDKIKTKYPKPKEGWTVSVQDTNTIYRYDDEAKNGDGENGKGKWIKLFEYDQELATEKRNGLMSKEHVAKLKTLETNYQSLQQQLTNHKHKIADVTDVNSNWQTLLKDTPAAYVTRWPDITEVAGRKKLTIKLKSGTTENTDLFTYDGAADKTVDITHIKIGAAATTHTHKISSTDLSDLNVTWKTILTQAPTAPMSRWPDITEVAGRKKLTIKQNGNNAKVYDVSQDIEVNITPTSVGAAASSHKHEMTDINRLNIAWQALLKAAPQPYVTRWPDITEVAGRKKLTIKLNGGGTNNVYDVSKDVEVNITANAIGAAAENHNHTLAHIIDLQNNWDNLLKQAPAAYVTRWPDITEVAGRKNLVIKVGAGGTEGSNQVTYDGSVAKEITISLSTLGDVSPKSHTHTVNQITDVKSNWQALLKAAPQPYVTRWPDITEVAGRKTLQIKLNGQTTEDTNMFTYDGSIAKVVNITSASIGAAATTHTHKVNSIDLSDLNVTWKTILTQAPTAPMSRWPDITEVAGRKKLTIKLNGGGTNNVYDVSKDVEVNITANAIGAAASSHKHEMTDINSLNIAWQALLKAAPQPYVTRWPDITEVAGRKKLTIQVGNGGSNGSTFTEGTNKWIYDCSEEKTVSIDATKLGAWESKVMTENFSSDNSGDTQKGFIYLDVDGKAVPYFTSGTPENAPIKPSIYASTANGSETPTTTFTKETNNNITKAIPFIGALSFGNTHKNFTMFGFTSEENNGASSSSSCYENDVIIVSHWDDGGYNKWNNTRKYKLNKFAWIDREQTWTAYQDFTAGAGNSGSDIRWKTNIKNIDSVLSDICKINVISYIWDKPGESVKNTFGVSADQMLELGGIYSLMVHERPDETATKFLDYDRFGVLAIKGIQELVTQNTERDKKTKTELTKLKKETKALQKELETLQQANEILSNDNDVLRKDNELLRQDNIELKETINALNSRISDIEDILRRFLRNM